MTGLLSACTVSEGSADGELTAVPESSDNPLFQPGVDNEDEGVNLVEAGEGDVVAEGDGPGATAQSVYPVEIITDPSDLPVEGFLDVEYDTAVVEAIGGSETSYDWTAEGLPAGLHLVELSGGRRVGIEGTIDEGGTHDITITASDPNDSTLKDSISYQLQIGIQGWEPDPGWETPACMTDLKVEMLSDNLFPQPDGSYVDTATLGLKNSIKARVTGGKGPYTVIVTSRVKDSYHKINYGSGHYGGNPSVHQTKGITNYKYRDPDGPCLTPEEAADIYGERVNEEDEDADSFWPNCSPMNLSNLSIYEKVECQELGCTGYWYDMSDEMQEQCTNGFDCSGANWPSLTPAQKSACMEHQSEETMEKVDEAMEKHYGEPEYVCKWTKNPTWRLKGKDAPDPEGTPSINNIIKVADSGVFTIVSEVEFDGPLPIDKAKNMAGVRDDIDFLPIEEVKIVVMDSCPVRKIEVVRVNYNIIYPEESMDEIEIDMGYDEVNQYVHKLGGPFGADCPLMEDKYEVVCDSMSQFAVVFTDEHGLDSPAQNAHANSWDLVPALMESVGFAHYTFKECDDSNGNCDEKPVENGESEKKVLQAYEAYLMWVAPTKLDGDDYSYADFNIKHLHFKGKYWYASFRDTNDDFNNNITKNYVRLDRLTDRDAFPGMSRSNSRGSLFHRRALIPGKWTY